ncbi:MAG: hypothetical protein P8Y37_00890, partial [Anaerolineales bacterium]
MDYMLLADILMCDFSPETAVKYYEKALACFKKEQDYDAISLALNRLSSAYEAMGFTQKSLRYERLSETARSWSQTADS